MTVDMPGVRTRKHYHVISGLCGYVPNTNETYETRKSAEAGARWWAETFRESNWDAAPEYKKRITGSARAGWYDVGDCEYIEVSACDMSECVCQDCGELLPGEGDMHNCIEDTLA
jgi:hypothetical protein